MKKSFALIIAMIMCIGMMTSCGGGGLTVPDEYNYDDLSKYITLGEYKGLEYEQEEITVTRHQVDAKLDELFASFTESTKLTEGTVTEDCTANIDYVGSMDGKEFDGGAGEGYDLDIDNSTFIDGFAEALVGHKVGENFDIDVTFPENYGSADLAGKPAVFNITVNYITVEKLPEYNDEFVKNNTDFSTTEELEESLKEELESEQKKEAANNAKADIFQKIQGSSKVLEYPEKEFNAKKDKLTQSYKDKAEAAGQSIADYIQQNLGMTEDEFNEQVKAYTETTVKIELIAHQIARLENIEFTADDYHDFVYGMLEEAGLTADEFKEKNGYSVEEFADQSDLFTSFVYQKVMDKVMEYSVAK